MMADSWPFKWRSPKTRPEWATAFLFLISRKPGRRSSSLPFDSAGHFALISTDEQQPLNRFHPRRSVAHFPDHGGIRGVVRNSFAGGAGGDGFWFSPHAAGRSVLP